MKVIRDADGKVVNTVERTHPILGCLGIVLGIGLLITLLSGAEGIGGILAGIAIIALLIFGAIMRSRSTQENPQPEESSEGEVQV